MKQTTCLYLGLALFVLPLLAIKVPHNDLLTIGQGYSTFLGRGKLSEAVTVEAKELVKRRETTMPQQIEQQRFNWVPPSKVSADVDLDEYFSPMDENAIDRIFDQETEQQLEQVLFKPKPTKDDILSRGRRAADGDSRCPGSLDISVQLFSDYTEYLRSVVASASATISYWKQSASISGSYLDQSKFSTHSMIYMAKIEIAKQQHKDQRFSFNMESYEKNKDIFNSVFGNKWVRGFETGGKLIARVTVTAKEGANKTDITANMAAAMGVWGASGEITGSANKSMHSLSEQATVRFDLFYQGSVGKKLQARTTSNPNSSPAKDAIMEAKSWAEEFLANACDHDFTYRALLDDYKSINNFPQSQSVWDYFMAEYVSYVVLKALVKISEMAQKLQTNEELTDEEQEEIRDAELDMVEAGKKWVDATADNPFEVRKTSKALIKRFNQEFITKFKPKLPKTDEEPRSKGSLYSCVEDGQDGKSWHCANVETGIWRPQYSFSSRGLCQTACDEAADDIGWESRTRDCAVSSLEVSCQLKRLRHWEDYESFFVDATELSNRTARWSLQRPKRAEDSSLLETKGHVYFPADDSPQLSNLTLAIGGIKSDGVDGKDTAAWVDF
ncbi:hypothetical protein CP532_2720 [Ophiocordyceps camponoti-leonardi (nom. inval.)]|nr:hypothetical protein CP532_2720 [Ophiocordyceps camponoti-leonardi (nom. inval.)]